MSIYEITLPYEITGVGLVGSITREITSNKIETEVHYTDRESEVMLSVCNKDERGELVDHITICFPLSTIPQLMEILKKATTEAVIERLTE